jgi:hypothetical protein
MSIKLQSAAVILSVIMTAPAYAQDDRNWTNLGTLKSGDRICVIQSDAQRVEGLFVEFSDSGISIRTGQATVIARDRVVRVYRQPRTRRSLRAVVAAAIGVAAGVMLSSTVGQRFRNEGQDNPAAAWIAGGAALGAGVGALTGGGSRTVYRRSK